MTHMTRISSFLAGCLLLALLSAHVMRPMTAQSFANAAAVQVVRRPVPLEEPQSQPAYGIYPGVVVSAPDLHMRVQVDVPTLKISREWASPCVPVGSKATPPLQSRIWVMFVQGNAHYPVWMGVAGN